MPPAIHAGCLILGTWGLLIRGEAGSGKSSLCDLLIEAARAKGNLGLLVADDYVHVTPDDGRLIARVPDTIRGKMEVRGFGLVDTAHAPEAHVRLIVDLLPMDRLDRLPETPLAEDCLEGVQVPVLRCPQNSPAISLRLVRWAFRSALPGGQDYI